MTLSELRTQIWERIGEPSDIDPSDDSTTLDFVCNEAQRQIAFWVDPQTGRQLRLRNLFGEMFFRWTVISGTLGDQSGAGDDEVVLPAADVGADDDEYNGWIVEVGSEKLQVMDYDGGTTTVTLQADWTSAPESGDSYSLYKRFAMLLPSSDGWASEHITLPSEGSLGRATGNLIEVLKLEDVDQQRVLEPEHGRESWPSLNTSVGDPTAWYRYGERIVFNYAPDEQRWFRMEYYRGPTDVSSDTDEPEIPELFHWGIVLWGTEWGFAREMEMDSKYSAKRDFEDFMRRTKSQYEVMWERESDHGILERR